MRKALHTAERLLWVVALLCIAWSGLVWQHAHAAGRTARRLAAAPLRAEAANPPGTNLPGNGAILGELRIPALRVRVPIVQGDDDDALRLGVGHIPETPLPGGLGTVGLAGHRDTFLRPLRRLRSQTLLEVSEGPSLYRYRVDSTEIVTPDKVDVLATKSTPQLVLVTCYPFHFIGHAPFRFIVHAHLLSLVPAPARN